MLNILGAITISFERYVCPTTGILAYVSGLGSQPVALCESNWTHLQKQPKQTKGLAHFSWLGNA